MDIEPTEGVDHAEKVAEQIACSNGAVPTIVFASPFLRTTHTADIIARRLKARVCIEEGLTEWLTPSLVMEKSSGTQTFPSSVEQLAETFKTIDVSYKSLNPVVTGDNANSDGVAPRFPESLEALLLRAQTTVSQLVEYSSNDNANIVIVSHAPCIQAIAYALEGVISTDESKLTPWPLGGITMFSRDIVRNNTDYDSTTTGWKMDMYGDTKHMPGKYKDGFKEWSLPCFEKTK
eukprot:CAMPEP_0195524008 /NCGR_PEP_ID=MMETSP0794_2-20130614/23602_1 /TAXON_ID=515487 /ORGANISM="Stephanopyxis turris, Strain CCMP 815" /LENGTH=233 /DNA_ID=CAMNT_0040654143 /DNA_START=169 /DNA_END=870 /DNA_ORIENTATION=+